MSLRRNRLLSIARIVKVKNNRNVVLFALRAMRGEFFAWTTVRRTGVNRREKGPSYITLPYLAFANGNATAGY